MSALSFKGPIQPPPWWAALKRVVALVLLGPTGSVPKLPQPDTVELARDGKISGWLRLD